METLTKLALKRCDTARCAIQIMGDLATQYGFYDPEVNVIIYVTIIVGGGMVICYYCR
jgi:dipeptidase